MSVNVDINSLKARLLDKIIANGRLRKKHIIDYYELNEITWETSYNIVSTKLKMAEIKNMLSKNINIVNSCQCKEKVTD